MKARALAIFAVSIFACVSAQGATYTVDDSGGADFLMIQPAVDVASYGDTVLVAAGYYNERVIMKNGVALRGAGADRTLIDGTAIDYSTVTCDGRFDSSTIIEGFRIQGGTGPGWSSSGVWLGVDCSAVVCHNVIIGNRIGVLSNYNNGDPKIDHNTIVLNGDCGIQVYVGNWTVVTGVTTITNNIVVGNANYGIYRGSDSTTKDPPHPDIGYNDVWGNGQDYRRVVPAATDISADPLFCMPPSDLGIEHGSPCEGAGSGGSDVGAFPAGCDVVAVEETSWGVIKALYR